MTGNRRPFRPIHAPAAASCPLCGAPGPIARALGACLACIRAGRKEPLHLAARQRRAARDAFGLPEQAPRTGSIRCQRCFRRCAPEPGAPGFCGVRKASVERSPGPVTGGDNEAPLHWYYDPLPTNCVADWVCAAGSGAASAPGSPGWHSRLLGNSPSNLAVFAYGCTFDCLYCQNSSCREVAAITDQATVADLARAVDQRTACVCFFGGDPTPQIPLALAAMERAARARSFPVCWETNGAMSPRLLERMIEISLRTDGTIKLDLKAWHRALHQALTGAPRRRVWDNLKLVISRARERREPPLAVVSTCLVPGYIDQQEVFDIASAVAALGRDTPYALLAFHPNYLMSDLPTTSRRQAEDCLLAARRAGLTRVRIGNLHLLA